MGIIQNVQFVAQIPLKATLCNFSFLFYFFDKNNYILIRKYKIPIFQIMYLPKYTLINL